MKNNILSIGYFQLDNLIKNRVPFVLINLGVDISEVYNGLYKAHLEKQSFTFEYDESSLSFVQKLFSKNKLLSQKIVTQLEAQSISKSQAIVVLCKNEKKSQYVHHFLTKRGFHNSYLVLGGWEKIKSDFQKEKI